MRLSNYLVRVLGVCVAYCQTGIESTFCNHLFLKILFQTLAYF